MPTVQCTDCSTIGPSQNIAYHAWAKHKKVIVVRDSPATEETPPPDEAGANKKAEAPMSKRRRTSSEMKSSPQKKARTVHSRSHLCQQCPFIAKSEERLTAHMKDLHPEVMIVDGISQDEKVETSLEFTCTICKYSAKSQHGLTRHLNSAHSDALKQHRCGKCEFVTVSERSLQQHKYVCHMVETRCKHHPDCEFETAMRKDMEYHFRNAHGQRLKYSCKECSFTDCVEHMLAKHVNEAHRRKRMRCLLCWYSASKSRNLVLHMKADHADWKDHIVPRCFHCGYKTRDVLAMERHGKETHVGDAFEPFRCWECGFEVFHGPTMAAHAGIHRQKAKAVTCQLCGVVCDSPAAMSRHIIAKHTRGGERVGN